MDCDSQFEAASTKEEQMGGPLIVHQVSFSVHIDCRVCICVGICHETSLCGRWTSSRWQGQAAATGSDTSVVWGIGPSALLCNEQTSLASSVLLQAKLLDLV